MNGNRAGAAQTGGPSSTGQGAARSHIPLCSACSSRGRTLQRPPRIRV